MARRSIATKANTIGQQNASGGNVATTQRATTVTIYGSKEAYEASRAQGLSEGKSLSQQAQEKQVAIAESNILPYQQAKAEEQSQKIASSIEARGGIPNVNEIRKNVARERGIAYDTKKGAYINEPNQVKLINAPTPIQSSGQVINLIGGRGPPEVTATSVIRPLAAGIEPVANKSISSSPAGIEPVANKSISSSPTGIEPVANKSISSSVFTPAGEKFFNPPSLRELYGGTSSQEHSEPSTQKIMGTLTEFKKPGKGITELRISDLKKPLRTLQQLTERLSYSVGREASYQELAATREKNFGTTKGMLHTFGAVGLGFVTPFSDTAYAVTHPVSTAKNIGYAVTHPSTIVGAIAEAGQEAVRSPAKTTGTILGMAAFPHVFSKGVGIARNAVLPERVVSASIGKSRFIETTIPSIKALEIEKVFLSKTKPSLTKAVETYSAVPDELVATVTQAKTGVTVQTSNWLRDLLHVRPKTKQILVESQQLSIRSPTGFGRTYAITNEGGISLGSFVTTEKGVVFKDVLGFGKGKYTEIAGQAKQIGRSTAGYYVTSNPVRTTFTKAYSASKEITSPTDFLRAGRNPLSMGGVERSGVFASTPVSQPNTFLNLGAEKPAKLSDVAAWLNRRVVSSVEKPASGFTASSKLFDARSVKSIGYAARSKPEVYVRSFANGFDIFATGSREPLFSLRATQQLVRSMTEARARAASSINKPKTPAAYKASTTGLLLVKPESQIQTRKKHVTPSEEYAIEMENLMREAKKKGISATTQQILSETAGQLYLSSVTPQQAMRAMKEKSQNKQSVSQVSTNSAARNLELAYTPLKIAPQVVARPVVSVKPLKAFFGPRFSVEGQELKVIPASLVGDRKETIPDTRLVSDVVRKKDVLRDVAATKIPAVSTIPKTVVNGFGDWFISPYVPTPVVGIPPYVPTPSISAFEFGTYRTGRNFGFFKREYIHDVTSKMFNIRSRFKPKILTGFSIRPIIKGSITKSSSLISIPKAKRRVK